MCDSSKWLRKVILRGTGERNPRKACIDENWSTDCPKEYLCTGSSHVVYLLRLIVWCFYAALNVTPVISLRPVHIHNFLEFFSPVLHTIFFPSSWLLSHMTICEDSGERGMNPVALTIINHQKEYWPSRRFKPATSCCQG